MSTTKVYFDFADQEYLSSFIREGGAAVKFVVAPNADEAADVHAQLRLRAEAHGYVYVLVDAADVRAHMIDQVFHAVARQVPWSELARTVVLAGLEKLRFPVPPDEALSLEGIARFNDYDFQQLRKDFNRGLQQEIFQDFRMAQEFRIAMLLLCQAEASGSPPARATGDAVIEWLTGTLRHISKLKQDMIFQKVARHNARTMLFSLAHWVQKAGRTGLVVDFDIRQCAVPSRNMTDKIFYPKAAAVDVYEVLRQLIDATDELSSCFTLVTCSTEFLSDPSRGLEKYMALRMRILEEVKDRNRENPFAALIRLEPDRLAAVQS